MTTAERTTAVEGTPTSDALAALVAGTDIEPALSTFLRAIVLAVVAALFVFPLANEPVVIAAAAGAFLGAVIARRFARTSLRLWALVAVVLLVGGAVAAVHFALTDLTPSFVPLLGGTAESAATSSDLWLFGAGAAVVALGLRLVSMRVPAAAVLEVAAIGVAFAGLVSAHRHGAINRPFEVADPILTRGGDPAEMIALLGGVALVVGVLFLLSERHAGRAVLQLIVLSLLLAGGGVIAYRAGGTLMSEVDDPLNLKGKGKDGQGNNDGNKKDKKDNPNEELEFKDKYERPDTPAPLAVVLFHEEYSAPTGLYYFRQTAFSQWNGTRLVQAARGDVDRDVAEGFPSSSTSVREPPDDRTYRVEVETTVGMLQDHTRPFGLEAPLVFSPWQNPNPRRFPRTYRVNSLSIAEDLPAFFGKAVGAPAWSGDQLRHYTEGPTDPRYKELTERVVRETLPPELQSDRVAQAYAITAWLGMNGVYSLRSKHAGAKDPTADFLFGDRTGYCVHFAHAAAFMLRSVGIPARVSAGYMVPEANRRGGSGLVVTGADSHAWPEVYINGVGWVVTDVAPQTVLSPPPPAPDPDLQRLLADFLRGQAPLAEDAKPREGLRGVLARYWALAERFLIGALLGVLALLVLGKFARRLAPHVRGDGAIARTAYVAALDALSDAGRRRRIGETREAFARRLAEDVPSFVALTDAHLAAAFGAGGSVSAPAVRAAFTSTRAELARAVPLWRRLMGLVLPWTWLASR
jgi:transglutaminase-like putative cysteine protease